LGKKLYIIVLGAPGSGKGTQAVNVSRVMKLSHISSGDLFRQAIERGDGLSAIVKSYMSKGILVPDEITIQMILQHLMIDNDGDGVVLDGFPRNLKQANALDKALAEQNKTIDKVLSIKVSEKEIIRRLKNRWLCRKCQTLNQSKNNSPREDERCKICGGELYQRTDDNAKTIKKRLRVYYTDTIPVIEYYRKKGKLLEIDGEGDVEIITTRIFDTLNKYEFITK
jgi:adenylate kinase